MPLCLGMVESIRESGDSRSQRSGIFQPADWPCSGSARACAVDLVRGHPGGVRTVPASDPAKTQAAIDQALAAYVKGSLRQIQAARVQDVKRLYLQNYNKTTRTVDKLVHRCCNQPGCRRRDPWACSQASRRRGFTTTWWRPCGPVIIAAAQKKPTCTGAAVLSGFTTVSTPRELAEPEVNRFLTHLAVQQNVAASTQNQALAALLFLYEHVLEKPLNRVEGVVRARKPKRLPVVLTREEVEAVLAEVEGDPWLVCSLLYGSGMRVLEGLRVRVKDLDFGRGEAIVRDGKGERDRVTVLPQTLYGPLEEHLGRVRAQHEADLRAGLGQAPLPYQPVAEAPSKARPAWLQICSAGNLFRFRGLLAPQICDRAGVAFPGTFATGL